MHHFNKLNVRLDACCSVRISKLRSGFKGASWDVWASSVVLPSIFPGFGVLKQFGSKECSSDWGFFVLSKQVLAVFLMSCFTVLILEFFCSWCFSLRFFTTYWRLRRTIIFWFGGFLFQHFLPKLFIFPSDSVKIVPSLYFSFFSSFPSSSSLPTFMESQNFTKIFLSFAKSNNRAVHLQISTIFFSYLAAAVQINDPRCHSF